MPFHSETALANVCVLSKQCSEILVLPHAHCKTLHGEMSALRQEQLDGTRGHTVGRTDAEVLIAKGYT